MSVKIFAFFERARSNRNVKVLRVAFQFKAREDTNDEEASEDEREEEEGQWVASQEPPVLVESVCQRIRNTSV